MLPQLRLSLLEKRAHRADTHYYRKFGPFVQAEEAQPLDFRSWPRYHLHAMRRVLGLVLAVGVIVTVVLIFSPGATGPVLAQSSPVAPTPDSSEKQVIDNVEVMELFFDPYYVDLRNSLKTAPEGRKEWRRVYIATYRLAEATNLLFSRQGEDYMATPEWNQLALESRTAIEAVGEAVRKLDYDLTKTRYIDYIKTCNNCHSAFELEEPTIVEPFLGANPQENGPTLF